MVKLDPRPVAVVTGGSGAVGRGVVRELAGAAYDIAVLARGRAGLDGARRDVEGPGSRYLALSVDRMSGHRRPVPPILQPEAAARAVRPAAEHPARNTWVGIATVGTVLGNRVATDLAAVSVGGRRAW